MAYKASDSVTLEFCIQNPSTGAATNADSTPTGTFARNGTDDGTVTVTVSNVDTGRYKAAFTIPSGAVAGDTCSLSVAGTVSSVVGKGIVWQVVLDAKRLGDITSGAGVNVTQVGGASQTGRDIGATLGLAGAGLTNLGDTRIAHLDADISTRSVYAGGAVASVTGAVGSVTGSVGSVTGSVGSVVGAVGSVTGNVGGNVTGSVGSVAAGGISSTSFAAGAIDAAAIATDAIGSAELAASAVSEIQSGLSTLTTVDVQSAMTSQGYTTTRAGYLDTLNGLVQAIWDKATSALTTAGSIGKRLVDFVTTLVYSAPPSAAAISTQVWSEPVPGSFTSGEAGSKLNLASSAGDPWATAIPGSYGSGTAGNIVGNRLDANITSRTSTSDIQPASLSGSERNAVADALLARQMTEAYAADGSPMTLSQALYMLHSNLGEFSIIGNTLTCKKLDGSTTSMTYTLNDAINPTSRTRTS
jgi:hypothetical protein